MKIKRGQIYLADLGEGYGSEQGGIRPVLVVQNNKGNKHSPTILVACITSKAHSKHYLPTHYVIPKHVGLKYDSLVMMEQILISLLSVGENLKTPLVKIIKQWIMAMIVMPLNVSILMMLHQNIMVKEFLFLGIKDCLLMPKVDFMRK